MKTILNERIQQNNGDMDFEDLRELLKAEGALGFESAENHQWRRCRLYPWGLGITAQSSILSKNLSIDHLISEKNRYLCNYKITL